EVTVVEASLPTAVHKLRAAFGDDRRERKIIETVSGIGYRISIPVESEDRTPEGNGAAAHYAAVQAQAQAASRPSDAMPRIMIVAAALAIGLAAFIVAFSPSD